MYKSRIRKWQIDKKHKRHEMLFATKVIEKRRREGKSTQITIRGQDIAEADVRKYFKRLKTSTASDAANAENAPTPPELSYGTPILQTIPIMPLFCQQVGMEMENEKTHHGTDLSDCLETAYTTINTSEMYEISMNATDSAWPVYTVQPELRAIRSNNPMLWVAQNNDNNLEALLGTSVSDAVSGSTHGRYFWQYSFLGTDDALHPYVPAACIYESVIHNIYAYLNWYYFSSDKWLPHKDKILGQRSLKSVVQADTIVWNDPRWLSNLVSDAVIFFSRGHGRRAVSMIDSACAIIQSLVKEQHPQLLSKLLVAVALNKGGQYKELIQAVLLHFYNIADIMLGPRHPLTQLSSWLAKASAQSVDVSQMGLRVLRDGYIQHAGHDHPESLEVMAEEAVELISARKLIEAETMLGNLQRLYETRIGPLSWESLRILVRLASMHHLRGDFASAKCVLEEHYRGLMQLKKPYNNINRGKVWNLRERALICRLIHEYAEMQVLVTEAWNVGTASLPADDIEMILLALDFPAAEWHTPQNAA